MFVIMLVILCALIFSYMGPTFRGRLGKLLTRAFDMPILSGSLL